MLSVISSVPFGLVSLSTDQIYFPLSPLAVLKVVREPLAIVISSHSERAGHKIKQALDDEHMYSSYLVSQQQSSKYRLRHIYTTEVQRTLMQTCRA